VSTARARRTRRTSEARCYQLQLLRRGLHQAAISAREDGESALSFSERVLGDPRVVAVYASDSMLDRDLRALLHLVWASARRAP
jgi:hypothetical protein